MLVIAPAITPACNDREQVKPMLDQLTQLPAALGKIKYLLTDNSFYSAANAAACKAHGIEPLMAVGGESHHPGPFEWFTEPPALPDNANPARCKQYVLRKQTVEPVFGIIKSVMGFRQFSLRGLDKVKGEWTLICLAWNLKRMASLHLQMGN
ncbi:transposase [uncultured Nitrosomonas sp.]|uniref:transposase n=1 Tax=uncultured Nitrosomonas sp. TaxID=156424 RepID=UPI00263A2529|nr:transposase [uncultured Nitrosomonas sp.]